MYELKRAHNTFTMILDSYSLQKNCSTFYDECSSLKKLNITVVVWSLKRKTVILLRVIVSKQPVIGEKSLLTFFSTAQPMNCDRSGNLNPLNETGVGALLKLFLCDTKPGKLVGVVNCWSLEEASVAAKTKPHWAVHTSSRRIASREASRKSWLQSVILREAHWVWKTETIAI